MELVPKTKPHYPDLFIPRISFFPKHIRVFFGKYEMWLRTKDKYNERISYIDSAFINKLPELNGVPKVNITGKVIWQYWDSGLSNAPAIVKLCINSVEHYKGSFQHIVLSDANIFEYVSLPDYLINKWSLISPTKRSNLVRLSLLSTYGGVWVDATCFFTGEIPGNYFNADLFLFLNTSEDRIIRNWFICSIKNNFIIDSLLKFHFWFYQNFTDTSNYFFFHYMFETLMTMNSTFRNIWVKSNPKIIYDNTIDLNKINVDCQNFNNLVKIINQNWINKLTWKISSVNLDPKFLSILENLIRT